MATPEVTIEMIRPEGRSRETEGAFGALIQHFYGEPGQEFIDGIRSKRLTADSRFDSKARINEHFFRAFHDTFKLPGTVTPQSAYDEAGKTALGVVSDLADLTGLSISQDPFVDEINPHPPSPTDLLYHLARLDQGRDLDLDFNVRRHFPLLVVAASMEMLSGNGHVRDILSDLQFKLNQGLYHMGEEGYHERYNAFTYHDIETNQFLNFAGRNPQPPQPDQRLLNPHKNMIARRIEGVGLVYTIKNNKEPVSAVEKALAKAINNGGVIRPESVEDYLRMTFVALEGHLPGSVRERTDQVDIIHNSVIAFLKRYRGINKIDADDDVDGDRGQAKVNWKRDKIYFPDTSVPLELVVVRESDHIDQILHIGKVDPITGIHDGKAHRLFELRRNAPVAQVILPTKITGLDFRAALGNRSNEIAEDLKHRFEITL